MTEMNQDLFQIQIADDTESEHIAAPQYSYWRSVFSKFCIFISSLESEGLVVFR